MGLLDFFGAYLSISGGVLVLVVAIGVKDMFGTPDVYSSLLQVPGIFLVLGPDLTLPSTIRVAVLLLLIGGEICIGWGILWRVSFIHQGECWVLDIIWWFGCTVKLWQGFWCPCGIHHVHHLLVNLCFWSESILSSFEYIWLDNWDVVPEGG